MRNIKFDDEQVSTLKELGEILAGQYGWTWWEAEKDCIVFKAKNADGAQVDGRLEPSGFAYDVYTEEQIDEFAVDWNEVFDGWSDYVWGEAEDGSTVMVHS